MPKFGSLGITAGKGFNGSYIDIKLLIDRRVVLNIEKYELRPSCMQGGQLCMMQVSISGRPLTTWHGSMKLIDIFQQCDQLEKEGTVCWPIEECIIVRGDDGGYFLQDADESCFRPTVEQVEELIELSHRRGSWRNRR